MEVCVLGPVEVDGRPVTGREATVIAALAVRAPRVATAEQLIDDVWGEDPPITANKSLQNAISRLRRLVGPEAIETVAGGYRLAADVDVHDVERRAATGDVAGALARWRGEPTAVSAVERVRLAERRSALEDELADQHLHAGRADEAIRLLEQLVADEPYRERRWVMLVTALGACGRQADALRAAQRARRRLADDLGLEPGAELLDAERAALADETQPRRRRRLPRYATSIIGRSAELAAVREALDRYRVVTLMGPGGVGKTRVALTVADPATVFVDLAAVARSEHVWEAVAAAAGVATMAGRPVAEAVLASLDDDVLLLLDSCEHVLDVAAEVAALTSARVLATSRESLGIDEERVIAIDPLARTEAVALFVDRTGADVDRDAVSTLCARLDDLPLAIELAAAQAPILDPAQLTARLDDRFALLDERARHGHPRHRALRAMVGWSADLLSGDERLLFERLSVFRSTFTIDDAEAVVTDDRLPRRAVAPAMTRLVRASMVTVDADRRCRLLDTFRDYGAASLAEPDTWHRRHLDWVAGFATAAAPAFSGPDQVAWFDRASLLYDDVQAALAWCADHGPANLGLQIAGDLFHFWMGRARRFEGLRWVREFAGAADGMTALDRCRILYGAGMIAMMQDLASVDDLVVLADQVATDRDSRAVADALATIPPLWRGDFDTAAAFAERCMPVIDEPQHDGTLPQVWDIRAWVAAAKGDLDTARMRHKRSIEQLAALEDNHLYGAWLSLDGDLAFAQGLTEECERLGSRALEIATAVACPSCTSSALTTLALVHDDPVEMLRRSYTLVATIGEQTGMLLTLPVLAGAVAGRDPALAARLSGVYATARHEKGLRYEMPGRAQFGRDRLERARDELGAAAWETHASEGSRYSLVDVIKLTG